MRLRKTIFGLLPIFLPIFMVVCAHPAAAQLPGGAAGADDPLARIREAAKTATPACSATGESLCEQVAPKIIANAQGDSPLADNVRRLMEIQGHPAAARAGEAAAWAVSAFHDSGLAARTEPYSIPVTWSEGASHLEVVAPSRFPVRVAAVGWTPATPRGGLEAQLVFAGQGSETDFVSLGGKARGSILLIHSEASGSSAELLEQYANAPAVVRRAAEAGAAAILWMSVRERNLVYRRVNTLTGELDPLPQAIIDRGNALELEHVLQARQKVRVRLELPNQVGPSVERQTVVAEIRGRELPNEWVLLGAGLDTDGGTSADACGPALVIEAARDIARTGVLPRRSIRFVLFTSDELGMLSNWAYVRAHRGELDGARAAILFNRPFDDSCSGRVTGYSLGGRMDLRGPVLDAMKPLASLGVNTLALDAPLEAGTLDFLLEGIPTLLAHREQTGLVAPDPAPGDHGPEKPAQIDLNELRRNTAIAGVTAFSLAELPGALAPRLDRAAIDQLLHDSGLAQQMQDVGLWKLWQTGERGRIP